MALTVKHKEVEFGVGDVVCVHQEVREAEKIRTQVFEGMVIGIKGHGDGKSFTVRRIGAQKVGIERIFPVNTPVVKEVEVIRRGKRGVRRAKLYYTREKAPREIEKIYSRASKREKAKEAVKKTSKKK